MASKLFQATSMPDRDWWAALWPKPIDFLQSLGIRRDMTVLDLCCGDGYFTAPLAKLVRGRVYGLDLDPAMLKQAEAEVAHQGASVLQWICADALEVARLLPMPVEYVLMANTFHGVPDQSGLARAVRSVLQPRGKFGVVNWHPIPREQTTVLDRPRGPKTDMRMSPETTATMIEATGFRVVKTVELPPYHYGIIFERAI